MVSKSCCFTYVMALVGQIQAVVGDEILMASDLDEWDRSIRCHR